MSYDRCRDALFPRVSFLFRFPAPVTVALRKKHLMSESTPSKLVAKSFCAAVNHLLAREEWAREQLQAYAGKTARLESPPFSIGLQVGDQGLLHAWPASSDQAARSDESRDPQGQPDLRGQPASRPASKTLTAHASVLVTETSALPHYDVAIRASASAASAFLQGGQAAAMKHVKIDGDAEFASTIARLAEHLRWEPEEDLAQLIGDAPAHQLAEHARATLAQARRSGQSLLESVAEYFLDENPQLVRHGSLDQMRSELVSLRDALARLEKRIERLDQKVPAARSTAADDTTSPKHSGPDATSPGRTS
jgi:ubiquinone biosynthesis protein UbiJ